jgi:hypothetical protein
MVMPLLEALTSQPALLDPSHTLAAAAASPSPPGTPGHLAARPHVAAAAATLQLRLLEALFFLPGAHMLAGCHATLLQLCCRQLQGGGSARVSPGAL